MIMGKDKRYSTYTPSGKHPGGIHRDICIHVKALKIQYGIKMKTIKFPIIDIRMTKTNRSVATMM